MVSLPAMVQVLGLAKEDKGMETVEVMDPLPVIRTNGMEMGTTAGPPDTMAIEARISTGATKQEDMEMVAEDGHLMLETGVTEDGVNETEWPPLYPCSFYQNIILKF